MRNLWYLVLALLLGLSAGCGGGGGGNLPQGLEMKFVPSDSYFAVSARPRDMLTRPELDPLSKPLLEFIKAEADDMPFELTTLEHVLVVGGGSLDDEPRMLMLMTFSQPYDQQQMRKSFLRSGQPQEVTVSGQTYLKRTYEFYQPEDPDCLAFLDERRALMGHESRMKLVFGGTGGEAAALVKSLRAAEATSDVVVAFDAAPLKSKIQQARAEGAIPPQAEAFAGLAERMNNATLSARLGKQLTMRLTLHCVDSAAAADAQKLIDGLLAMAKVILPAAGQEMPAGMEKVTETAADLLNKITVTQSGSQVQVVLDNVELPLQELATALQQSVTNARTAAQVAMSRSNLRQIGVAIHNVHDNHNRLPARCSFDADGKPLLSWRVHLLPYLDQQALYQQFKLDEPWDSPHNKALISRMPDVYKIPGWQAPQEGLTCYLAVVGSQTMFPLEPPEDAQLRQQGHSDLRFSAASDGLINTGMIVEAAPSQAVIWTKPDDWEFDAANYAKALVGLRDGKFLVLLGDGSTLQLKDSTPAQVIEALFTREGGETIDLFEYGELR